MPKTKTKIFTIQKGNSPIVATAIHDGHNIRKELLPFLALDDAARLREEDPFTGLWTEVAENQVKFTRSRFEVDVNRPREQAIYRKPADSWGLRVWKNDLPSNIIKNSLREYDDFYAEMYKFFTDIKNKYGKFVVLDIHSYNHRRSGQNAEPADAKLNPEINIGTGTMPRKYWGNIVDRFISDLQKCDYGGRNPDVRENVKFPGGNFMKWVHKNFPRSGCALTIEFKKIFIDEWTGIPNERMIEIIKTALSSTIPGIKEELKKLGKS